MYPRCGTTRQGVAPRISSRHGIETLEEHFWRNIFDNGRRAMKQTEGGSGGWAIVLGGGQGSLYIT
eukprot:656480-Prorocentrum_minimum.AAC.1